MCREELAPLSLPHLVHPPLVEVEVWDESGGVTLQFLGRREISGLDVGSQLKAEGMVGEDNGQLIILNPSYEIIV